MNKVWILGLCALSSMQLNASHDELVDILSMDNDTCTILSILHEDTIEIDPFKNSKEVPAASFSFSTSVSSDENEKMLPEAKKPMEMEMEMKNKNHENRKWADAYVRVIHYWPRDYVSSKEALMALFAVTKLQEFKANHNLYNDDEPTID